MSYETHITITCDLCGNFVTVQGGGSPGQMRVLEPEGWHRNHGDKKHACAECLKDYNAAMAEHNRIEALAFKPLQKRLESVKRSFYADNPKPKHPLGDIGKLRRP